MNIVRECIRKHIITPNKRWTRYSSVQRCKNPISLPCISSESHPITMIAWGCSQIFSELDIPKVVKNWIKPWKSEGLSSKICPRVVLRVIILTWGAQPLKESLIIWNPEDVPLLFRLLDKKNQRVCGPEQCMTNIQMYLNIKNLRVHSLVKNKSLKVRATNIFRHSYVDYLWF